MNAKEYLEQSRKIRQEIIWISRQIEKIETELGYHLLQLDDTGGSHSNFKEDKMSKLLSEVGDLYTDLNRRKAQLILKDEEIYKTVSKLEGKEREVLVLRYLTVHPKKTFAPLGWRQIGFRMGYTAEGARYIHDKALKDLGKIISTET